MSKIIPRQKPLTIAASPVTSPEGMSPGMSPDFPKPSSNFTSTPSISTNPMTTIGTSKEWVLPPRPKPGRKPSADTPASKRKAQNRAAQRAFRERRATRVQELEIKLSEVEKERDQKELGFINTINKLRSENQFLIKNIEKLRADVYALRNSNSIKSTAGSMSGNTPIPVHSPLHAINSVNSSASNPHSPMTNNLASPAGSIIQQQISPAPSGNSPPAFINDRNQSLSTGATTSTAVQITATSDDCGVCVKEECFCEEVGLKEKKRPLEETINSFAPMAAVSLKKRKASTLETDFTKTFSSKRPMPDLSKLAKKVAASRSNNELMESNAQRKPEAFNEASPVENCGFCSDDTPCVCREAAKEAASINNKLNSEIEIKEDEDPDTQSGPTSLPPILNSNVFRKSSLPVMHPGPTVEIRDISNLSPGAVPTVVGPTSRPHQGSLVELAAAAEASTPTEQIAEPASSKSKPSGCTGNPGTCDQCQMDPMSTLFCTTVANIAKKDTKETVKQSQQKKKKEELEQAKKQKQQEQQKTQPTTQQSEAGMYIPCSDAYKTLSRHKKFNSVDFGTLVGKLTTRGMQVEVQSVANVLRELDRRLYN